MNIEHFAFQVPDPAAFAAWYGEHLGMKTLRAGGAPTFTHFIASPDGAAMLEIYRNEKAPVPDYPNQDPLVIHLGFASKDPEADRDRLLQAGASHQAGPVTTAAGDVLIMLRDPWGFPIQLCKRAGAWK
ncbi:MAG: VOC family protein [Verrucomicrobia bacterium]|nr:VOC family protein [Verrucomicrobiota bacterium]MCH8526650.1 VOC family protein [Kiritimatiellia bacterium]